MTKYRELPCSTVEELFGFGLKARQSMRDYVGGLSADEWTRIVELNTPGGKLRGSVRKILFHSLMHEVRHWAQIARIMRERGFIPPGSHDLLTSRDRMFMLLD